MTPCQFSQKTELSSLPGPWTTPNMFHCFCFLFVSNQIDSTRHKFLPAQWASHLIRVLGYPTTTVPLLNESSHPAWQIGIVVLGFTTTKDY